MSYPVDTARVVLRGTLSGGEIFETGFGVLAAGITSEALADSYASSIAGIFAGTGSSSWMNALDNGSHLTEVRVYGYPTGGSTATYVGAATVAATDGLSTGHLPDQTCLVLTLRTGLSGRRNRGRMYLPFTGATVTTGNLFTNTQVSAVVSMFGARLSAVNALSDTATVAVISTVGTTAHPVLTVTADQRPDVQRRRANRQAVGSVSTAAVTV